MEKDRLEKIEERQYQDSHRLARLEEKTENIQKLVEELLDEVKKQNEKLQKLEARVKVISVIASAGTILVWEYLRKKLQF